MASTYIEEDTTEDLLIRKKDPWYKSIVLGYATGTIYVLVGHPLDSVRTRLQTETNTKLSQTYKHNHHVTTTRTIVSKFSKISLWRKYLFTSLYKGVTPALISTPLAWSVNFYFYQLSLTFIRNIPVISNNTGDITQIWIAAFLSSFSWCAILTPSELIKVYSQRYHVNSFQALKKVYQFNIEYTNYYISKNYPSLHSQLYLSNQSELNLYQRSQYRLLKQYCGVRTIFRGYNAFLVRSIPECCLYFAPLEFMRRYIPGYQESTFWKPFIAGSITGSIVWTFAFPGDTIKAHIQTNIAGGNNDKFESSGFIKHFRIFVAQNGYLALWRGLSAMLLRAPILAGTGIVGMETINNWLNERL